MGCGRKGTMWECGRRYRSVSNREADRNMMLEVKCGGESEYSEENKMRMED